MLRSFKNLWRNQIAKDNSVQVVFNYRLISPKFSYIIDEIEKGRELNVRSL
jgi:hypothetical protein